MFNAPRRPNGQSLSSSAFISSSVGGSSYADPLAQSTPNVNANASYGEVDPWSAVPSPARSGTPRGVDTQDIVVPSTEPAAAAVMAAAAPGSRDGLNAFFSKSKHSHLVLRK